MTKAQALALMNALEPLKIGASAVMMFDGAGVESWNVQLDTKATYSGVQVGQLATYCATNGLTLSLVIQQMGVV